MVPEIY